MASSDIYNQQMAAFDNSPVSNAANYGGYNYLTGQGDALATTNRFTAEQAALANQFSHDEAQLNRDFQERMSNTQYQRAYADMKAAGINPLNLGGIDGASVASTAAGQAHSGSGANPGQNGFTGFLVGLLKLGAALASSGASAAASAERTNAMKAIASLKAETATQSNAVKSDIAYKQMARKDLQSELHAVSFQLDKLMEKDGEWTKADDKKFDDLMYEYKVVTRKIRNQDYLK